MKPERKFLTKTLPGLTAALAAALWLAAPSMAVAKDRRAREFRKPSVSTTTRAERVAAIDSRRAEDLAYATVRERLGTLKTCYLAAARHGQTIQGKAEVSFTVAPHGRATHIRVESAVMAARGISACVHVTIASWRFPRAAGTARISFPLLFVRG